MGDSGHWRYACVTRAQTVARGMRVIDLAIEGPPPRLGTGSRARFAVAVGGAPAIRTFDCIPAPNGRIRVTVHSPDEGEEGLRFMWSLIEGAIIRMTIPEFASKPRTEAAAGAAHFLPRTILSAADPIIIGRGGHKSLSRHGESSVVTKSSIV